MGFLAAIVKLLGGGIFGSITGLVGHYLTSKSKVKMLQMQYLHQENMAKEQINLMNAEANAGVRIAQSKTQGDIALSNAASRKITYLEASKNLFNQSYMAYLPKWVQSIIAFMFSQVDVLRALIRPTLAIIYTAVFLFILIKSYINSPASFIASATILIDFIIYIVATIIAWYYADRSLSKYTDKLFNRSVAPIETPPMGQWYQVNPKTGTPIKVENEATNNTGK